MLEPLPENRPNIKEVLQHPWIKGYLTEDSDHYSEEEDSNIANAINNMKNLTPAYKNFLILI